MIDKMDCVFTFLFV